MAPIAHELADAITLGELYDDPYPVYRRLRREAPEKVFIPGPTETCACADCRYMKMNTLEKLHDCLLNLEPEIVLPEEVRARAEKPIRRMLELSA